MPLALIPKAHTTALAILPILGMVLYVKVRLLFSGLVLLNIVNEHAELVIQILDKRKHKSLSRNTLRNYCHS